MTKKNELNRDVIISGLGIGLLYYFFPKIEILIIGASFMILCFLFLGLKDLNHKFWLTFTKVLGSITNPVLFGAIFILLLIPIGFLYRVFKKKKLHKTSTFETVERPINISYFKVPW